MKTYVLMIMGLHLVGLTLASEPQAVAIKFTDGTEAVISSDVIKVFRDSKNAVNSIELKSGAIFYDSEILETTYQVNDAIFTVPGSNTISWPQDFALDMGGDGSGGG